MKQNKVTNFLNTAWLLTKRKSPEVLTGLSILGLWSTTYKAYRSGLVAHDILMRYRQDMHDTRPNDRAARKAVIKETAREMVPVVLPIVLMGGVTTGCIIGSNRISNKRIATLSAAYVLSDSALKEANQKLDDVLTLHQKDKVKGAIAKDRLKKAEEKQDPSKIIVAGNGDVLCMDSYTGRFFHSSAQKIGQAINILSADCQVDMYVSLNDFYDQLREFGANELDRVPMGDDFGWNVDDLDRGQLPITISAQLTSANEPCLCVEYDVHLRADFRNLY